MFFVLDNLKFFEKSSNKKSHANMQCNTYKELMSHSKIRKKQKRKIKKCIASCYQKSGIHRRFTFSQLIQFIINEHLHNLIQQYRYFIYLSDALHFLGRYIFDFEFRYFLRYFLLTVQCQVTVTGTGISKHPA